MAARLRREHRAGLHRDPVQGDGTRSALGGVTPDVRPGQPELVAEKMDEQRPGWDLPLVRAAVHRHLDGDLTRACHRLPPAIGMDDVNADGPHQGYWEVREFSQSGRGRIRPLVLVKRRKRTSWTDDPAGPLTVPPGLRAGRGPAA